LNPLQNSQFQNPQFIQYPNIQTEGVAPGLGLGVGMGGGMQGGIGAGMGVSLDFPSLEKISKPLNERVKYVINTVNYLLNNHHIGKFLKEEVVLKILHNSFFF
jgi:hypothetical protein